MGVESHQNMPERRRVLLAKIGLDGHDRGIKVVARALRDAGMEVVYLGLHNTPEQIVASAIQEDADAIGLSIHSAAHMTLFKKIIDLLKKEKASDIPIFGGGIVPEEDISALKDMGVKNIFTPGTSMDEIVSFVNEMIMTSEV
ncbi:B12 binding domain of Methylmalonyl-CoA mutase [hydrothermal vent metagenome]|uniref:B12 binding domain of Methylmalonyl-CoA mutase n=1 Tax=hydrothermal vent metagenome TaxID=652676 RepID=A0A3B1DWT0_9ZZZZ